MTELWAHQKLAVELAMKQSHFAFLFEQGTGKTLAAITTLRRRIVATTSPTAKVLILTPLITLENWRRELQKHAPELYPKVIILTGPGPRRLKFLRTAADHSIIVMSHETLLVKGIHEHVMNLWPPDVLIVDESHRYKSLSARRTKRAIQISTKARLRMIMTGTAVTNGPMEVFSQWRILDRGETFGTSFQVFRATYFYDENAGMPKQSYFPKWVLQPGALEAINEKLKATSLRVKKVDCLDLPPIVRKEVFVEMGVNQRRLYDEMKKNFVAVVSETEAAVASLAMVKAMRLMQIASGFIVTEETVTTELFNTSVVTRHRRTHGFKDDPRAVALRELLADLTPDHKVLIWAVFKDNYQTIREVCESLKIKAVEIHGEVSPKKKQEAVDALNADPEVRVLFGHPKSGGIGINLVAASYMIFYSRGFSLEDDLQAEARNYRGGSEIHDKVTRIDIMARGTIDEDIAIRLANKEAVSEEVLKGLVGSLPKRGLGVPDESYDAGPIKGDVSDGTIRSAGA